MDFCCAFLRYFVVQKIGTGTHRGLPSAGRRAGKVQSSFPSSTLLRNSQISVRHSTSVFNPISPACRQTGLPAAGRSLFSFSRKGAKKLQFACQQAISALASYLPTASCLSALISCFLIIASLKIECPTPSEECRKCDN